MIPDINSAKAMQIATVRDELPWICTVYFVLHDKKFYWLSFPERRHSSDIADDPHVAIAIVIKPGKPVIGIQAEAVAHIVADPAEVAAVLAVYVDKYGQGKEFVQRFLAGENRHALYCAAPSKVILFDEYTSRKQPQRDITNIY